MSDEKRTTPYVLRLNLAKKLGKFRGFGNFASFCRNMLKEMRPVILGL